MSNTDPVIQIGNAAPPPPNSHSKCHSPNKNTTTNNNNSNNPTIITNPEIPYHSPLASYPFAPAKPNTPTPTKVPNLNATLSSQSPLVSAYHRHLPTLQGFLLKHSSSSNNSGLSSSTSSATSTASSVIGHFRKKRWFVFSPVTGQLYYYRTRDDSFPIGVIDIRSASFVIRSNPAGTCSSGVGLLQSYVQSALSNTFVFDIVTGAKTVTLEASSAAEGFRWVKNLQVFRHYLCNQYLGLETDLANNNDLLDLLAQQESQQSNSQPNSLDSSIAASPVKSVKSDRSSSPSSSSPQSQSIFYLCDNLNNNNNTNPSSVSSSTTTNNNNNNTNSNNNNNQEASSSSSSAIITKPLSLLLRLSPDAKVGTRGGDQTAMITSPSSVSSTTSGSASTPSARPKLFGGIVNRMRQSSSGPVDQYSSGSLINNSTSMNNPSSSSCGRCKRLEEQLITLQHDRFAFEDEIKTNREVIKILQEQLRIFNSEKATFDSSTSSTGSLLDGSETVKPMDRESLAKELLTANIQSRCLQAENDKLAADNRKLTTTNTVLQEMLESRDRTLVSLTHEVYDLESKNSRMATRAELEREYLQDEMPRKVQQRLEQLEDTVTAFEQQNEFLNKEIIELNELRHRMEQKEKQSQAKLCEVEAKCSQIQSKLLSLLKELNQCIQEEDKSVSAEFHNQEPPEEERRRSSNPFFATNESVRLLVNRLLEESSLDIPLSWRPGNRPRDWERGGGGGPQSGPDSTHPEYDELGFYVRPSDLDPAHTYDLMLEPDRNEQTWRTKWDQFISNLPAVEQSLTGLRSLDLKQMLRLGVPQDYRCKIWRMLITQRVRDRRARLGEDYYESLHKQSIGSPISPATKVIDPAAKQIELDLLRTLPNNKHFEHLESDGIGRLRRVLTAYSVHNRAVGYCQGLNRLAAVALLFMPEEDAFWCLVAIVETIMPVDYFGRNLMGAHVDQYVLRELITEKLPQLSAHMEQYHIEISLFAWFLTVFVDNIPVSVYLHIWDVFLYEGSKVLFRFALAILRMHEHDLLSMKDSASFNQYLRTLDERHFNLKRLSEIAFRELNPFSSSRVRAKRQHHTALVQDELRKIEAIRSEVQQQRDAHAQQQSRKTTSDDRSSGTGGPKATAGRSSTADALISFDDNDSDD